MLSPLFYLCGDSTLSCSSKDAGVVQLSFVAKKEKTFNISEL